MVAGPSSTPGRMWQCRSVVPTSRHYPVAAVFSRSRLIRGRRRGYRLRLSPREGVRLAARPLRCQPVFDLLRNSRRFGKFQHPDTPNRKPAMSVQSATDIRQHLELLEIERAMALETALRNDPAYMSDLRDEIVATRHAYVGSAVAEIASFRGQLSGPQHG
jgi:hypothetical protein